MADRSPAAAALAALDPGPVLEIGDWQAVRRHGGLALLAWRQAAMQAAAAGCPQAPSTAPDDGRRFAQALVHHGRGRAGTLADLAMAWQRLAPGGRLWFAGSNADGIRSTAAAWAAQVAGTWTTVASAGHGRVLVMPATGAAVVPPSPSSDAGLRSSPGTFAAGRRDDGTALLLAALAEDDGPAPAHLADPCCGNGVLALAALARWPAAGAWLGDADARAVADAQANAAALGVAGRCAIDWWAIEEGLAAPAGGWDLILANPPWHHGHAVDRRPAERLLGEARAACAPGGRVLVVATRTQPFEALLPGCVVLRQSGGFKILAWRR